MTGGRSRVEVAIVIGESGDSLGDKVVWGAL